MSTTAAHAEVREYLRAIERELDDLSEPQRRELLEDLEQHLYEVAAEDEGTLAQRLGPPAEYAAELRLSAGLPARGDAAAHRRIRDRWPGRAVAFVRGSPVVRAIREFLPEAKPGWWVLRGYGAVVAVAVLLDGGSIKHIPIPQAFSSRLVGLLLIGFAVWASVAMGRRWRQRGAVWIERSTNVAVVAAGLFALANLHAPYPPQEAAYLDPGDPVIDAGLIRNICPYAADGTPLQNVLLFDQDGRPVTESGLPGGGLRNAYPRPQGMFTERYARSGTSCPAVTKVEISATDAASWIEATVGDATVFVGTLQPGQTQTIVGAVVQIVAGNAASTKLVVDGRELGPLGGPGQVYRATFKAAPPTPPPASPPGEPPAPPATEGSPAPTQE